MTINLNRENTDDGFQTIGLGLRARSRAMLRLAFPECLLYGGRAEDFALARERCAVEQRVTIFVDVPASGELAHQRTSLLFDQAKVKVVGLCEECTDEVYDSALRWEFSGAMPVESSVDTYRRVAAAVQRGELWMSRDFLSERTRQHLKSPGKHGLSEREMSILRLMVEDKSNQEIADSLFIARETVRWHLKSIYGKLGVSDRESARRFAGNVLSPLL